MRKPAGQTFGPRTLVIAWSDEYIAMVQSAIDRGCPALAGVSVSVLGRVPDNSRALHAWGGTFVAVCLPHALFARAMQTYLDNAGTLDVTHAVIPLLKDAAFAFLQCDVPKSRRRRTTSLLP